MVSPETQAYSASASGRMPILVPYWIINTLRRNQMAPKLVLDLPQLKKVCSSEDLAIMLALNNNPERVTGLRGTPTALVDFWSSINVSAYREIETLIPLYADKLDDRLFSDFEANSTQNVSEDSLVGKAFELLMVETPNARCLINVMVINPGYFGGKHLTMCQRAAVREHLTQSYAFSSFSVLANSPLFAKYVANLAEPVQAL